MRFKSSAIANFISRTKVASAALLLVSSLSLVVYYTFQKTKKVEKKKNEDEQEIIICNDKKLYSEFVTATKEASTIRSKMTEADQLLFYGLYKQATVGNAPDDKKPSPLNILSMYKYDAWCKFKDLSQEEAMKRYIEMIQHFSAVDENADIVYSDDDEYHSDSNSSNNDKDEQESSSKTPVRDRTTEYGLGLKPSSLYLAQKQAEHEDVNDETLQSLEEQLRNAAASNNLQKIQTLLEINSSSSSSIINSCDETGQTALHFAADKCSIEIIKCLLEKGADPNVQDEDGISVLHTVVSCVSEDQEKIINIIDLLKQFGAKIDILDNDGLSSLDYAKENEYLDLITVLS